MLTALLLPAALADTKVAIIIAGRYPTLAGSYTPLAGALTFWRYLRAKGWQNDNIHFYFNPEVPLAFANKIVSPTSDHETNLMRDATGQLAASKLPGTDLTNVAIIADIEALQLSADVSSITVFISAHGYHGGIVGPELAMMPYSSIITAVQSHQKPSFFIIHTCYSASAFVLFNDLILESNVPTAFLTSSDWMERSHYSGTFKVMRTDRSSGQLRFFDEEVAVPTNTDLPREVIVMLEKIGREGSLTEMCFDLVRQEEQRRLKDHQEGKTLEWVDSHRSHWQFMTFHYSDMGSRASRFDVNGDYSEGVDDFSESIEESEEEDEKQNMDNSPSQVRNVVQRIEEWEFGTFCVPEDKWSHELQERAEREHRQFGEFLRECAKELGLDLTGFCSGMKYDWELYTELIQNFYSYMFMSLQNFIPRMDLIFTFTKKPVDAKRTKEVFQAVSKRMKLETRSRAELQERLVKEVEKIGDKGTGIEQKELPSQSKSGKSSESQPLRRLPSKGRSRRRGTGFVAQKRSKK